MSVEYQIYRKEILNFLSTLTIKFSPFAKLVKENALNQGYTFEYDKDNPYYLNICGLYSPIDSPIYLTDTDTNKEILLTVDLKYTRPDLIELYRIPSNEYQTLLLTYPKQTGLIKSIFYPGKDVQSVIDMDDLDIINCDTTLLYSEEKESLMTALTRFLNHVKERWYIKDYDYEPGYPIAFMGIIYSILPQVLLTQRILNIRTNQVHPLHIWEYLSSKGLGNYRDILNNKQALFLYRNMNYLYRNKGKKSNLKILADNLLEDLKVSLVGKNILQESETSFNDNGQTVPEFISENIVNYSSYESMDESTVESMDVILRRINKENLYPDFSAEDTLQMQDKFAQTNLNILPTRLLEFKKFVLDTRYLSLMIEFIIDSLMLNIVNRKLNYNIDFIVPDTDVEISLSVKNAVLFWEYCHYRYLRNYPVDIPKLYTTRIPFVLNKPDINIIKKDWFHFRGYDYQYDSIIDTKRIITDINYTGNTSFRNVTSFIDHTAKQFSTLIAHTRYVRSSADYRYQECMLNFYNKYLVDHYTYDLNLTDDLTFPHWLEKNEKLKTIVDTYNRYDDSVELYEKLCATVMMGIFPIEKNQVFKQFAGSLVDDTYFYKKMKELFIRLCSKRLLFLDTDRSEYIYITKPTQAIYTEYHSDSDVIKVKPGVQTIKEHTQECSFVDITPFQVLLENEKTVEVSVSDELMFDTEEQLKYVLFNESSHHILRQKKNLYGTGDESETTTSKLQTSSNLLAITEFTV